MRFGVFELDTQKAELRKHGHRLRIQEQPLRVLTALLEHPGDIVTRAEMAARLWPADTFVDFERSLNAAVNRLRQVLDDSAEAPRYVETVARRGYRFIGPVIPDPPLAAPIVESTSAAPLTTQVTTQAVKLWRWGVVATIAAALATGCIIYVRSSMTASVGPVLTRITSDAGLTTEPAASPDGKMLAYVSDRNGRNLNLWVQQSEGGTAVQLTHGEAVCILHHFRRMARRSFTAPRRTMAHSTLFLHSAETPGSLLRRAVILDIPRTASGSRTGPAV